jgi:hypothetical protein
MDTNPCIGLLVEAMDTPIESAPSQLASARSTYPEVEPIAATMAPVPPGPAPDKPREKRRKSKEYVLRYVLEITYTEG